MTDTCLHFATTFSSRQGLSYGGRNAWGYLDLPQQVVHRGRCFSTSTSVLHLEKRFHCYILEDAVSAQHLLVPSSALWLQVPHSDKEMSNLSLDEGSVRIFSLAKSAWSTRGGARATIGL